MKYQIGQYIMYGSRGVCRVEDIGTPKFLADAGKEYYTLRPPFTTSDERIYVPVNTDVHMESVMTSEEALHYLENLRKMRVRPLQSSKKQLLTDHYQRLLSNCDANSHLQLLKELRQKERTAAEKGKKLGITERQFQKKAERLVSEEFAVALHESPEDSAKRLSMALE